MAATSSVAPADSSDIADIFSIEIIAFSLFLSTFLIFSDKL